MVDNIDVTPGAGSTVATDDVGGVQYQRNKIDLGADGAASPLVRGQLTKANSLPVTLASDEDGIDIATGQKIQITDGTSDATVRNLAANDALNVAIVDGSGNQVTSFAGSGGTSSTDDADFTAASTAGTPIMGVFESTPTTVTDFDMGIIGIDTNRRVRVSVDASTLDVAHGVADTGAPVKTGARAQSALPTAEVNNDRVNNIADLFGRLMTTHIDPAMQVAKSFNATTTQTGVNIWVPAGGKKIALTHLQIGSYATTAARCIIWYAATGTTAFVEGTHQVAFKGSFAPSSTSKPGAVVALPNPIYCTTADFCLKITTDAAMSVDVVAYGYEF